MDEQRRSGKMARCLPGIEPRVETGPVQFGDDWPGVFIRGDNAGAMIDDLQYVKAGIGGTHPRFCLLTIDRLIELLESCQMKR